MVTDQQYWRLMKLRRTEKTLAQAAAKAGMDEKTARKYLRLGKPPSQLRKGRGYRTRKDNFAGVWRELEELLEREPGLEALTLMEHLCRQYPGQFQMSQLRTLQRQVKRWRALAVLNAFRHHRNSHCAGSNHIVCRTLQVCFRASLRFALKQLIS